MGIAQANSQLLGVFNEGIVCNEDHEAPADLSGTKDELANYGAQIFALGSRAVRRRVIDAGSSRCVARSTDCDRNRACSLRHAVAGLAKLRNVLWSGVKVGNLIGIQRAERATRDDETVIRLFYCYNIGRACGERAKGISTIGVGRQ